MHYHMFTECSLNGAIHKPGGSFCFRPDNVIRIRIHCDLNKRKTKVALIKGRREENWTLRLKAIIMNMLSFFRMVPARYPVMLCHFILPFAEHVI